MMDEYCQLGQHFLHINYCVYTPSPFILSIEEAQAETVTISIHLLCVYWKREIALWWSRILCNKFPANYATFVHILPYYVKNYQLCLIYLKRFTFQKHIIISLM